MILRDNDILLTCPFVLDNEWTLQDSAPRPQLSSSSSVVPSPNPEGSQVSNEPVPPPFPTSSVSNSPVLNGSSVYSGHRGRSLVDPIIALTSMEGNILLSGFDGKHIIVQCRALTVVKLVLKISFKRGNIDNQLNLRSFIKVDIIPIETFPSLPWSPWKVTSFLLVLMGNTFLYNADH